MATERKWFIGDDSISPFSLQTSNIGEKLYGVVSSSVWMGNPEVDGAIYWIETAEENWSKSSHGHRLKYNIDDPALGAKFLY